MSKKKTTRFKEYISDSADVRPDRLDLRDRMYQPPLSSLPAQVPQQSFKHAVQSYIDADMILDQKKDGACTGFAMAAVINFLFWRKTWHETAGLETAAPETAEQPESADDANQIPSDRDAQWSAHVANLKSAAPKVSARMLYHLARFYDEWPGEQNTGSSLRGAVKAWYRHGVCREEYWRSGATFESPDEKWAIDAATRPVGVYYRISRSSVVDMQAAIHEVGAILVSARIHNGWEALLQTKYNRVQAFTELTHDNIAQIQWTPTTKTLGMHAFALVGYNQYGFIIQNSWGKTWGAGGFAVLTYSDWVNNGVDAWVAVLGAPVEKSSPPLRVYIESSRPRDRLTSKDKSDELVINADFWKRGKGLVTRGGTHQPTNEPKPDVRKWSVQECYEHCITLGSNGRAINRLIDRQNASSATHYIACQRPSEQFGSWHRGRKSTRAKLVIFALSGLLPDSEELSRMRTLGPCFEANNVYPIFIGWRTGFLDSFLDLAGKQIMAMLPKDKSVIEMLLGERDQRSLDAWDRTMEAMFESEGGKPMWTQFKQDGLLSAQRTPMVRRATEGQQRQTVKEQSALYLLAKSLGRLKYEWTNLEIHFVGHSGGAIPLAHFLAPLGRELKRSEDKTPIKSCSLFAPACSLWLAKYRFRFYMNEQPLINPKKFRVYTLADEFEKTDKLGPYHKSFLYLVSNALEDWSGAPLLGMEHASNPAYWHPATRGLADQWYETCKELEIPKIPSIADRQIKIGPNAYLAPTHEFFPENIKLINETLKTITGKKKLKSSIKNLDWMSFVE